MKIPHSIRTDRCAPVRTISLAVALVLFMALSAAAAPPAGSGPPWGGPGTNLGEALQALEDRIAALEAENAVQAGEIATLQAENAAQAGAISTLQAENATQAGDIAALQAVNAEARLAALEGLNAGARLTTLEGDVAALAAATAPLAVMTLAGDDLLIEGVNVHIRSGSGATNDFGSLLGLGNLIIGYNEDNNLPVSDPAEDRSGSHNLVIGIDHTYASYGGMVVGFNNAIKARHATVSGGEHNRAGGEVSSVSGGRLGSAHGVASSVSGGQDNSAVGNYAAVSGGRFGRALGYNSAVTGGIDNIARGNFHAVSGGDSCDTGDAIDSRRWAAGALTTIGVPLPADFCTVTNYP